MPFIKNASVTRKKTTSISTTYNLYTWGFNTSGQLGDGTVTTKSSPVFISGNVTVTSAGGSHSHFIKQDYLWAMGSNSSGRLGDGTTTTRSSPVQIGTTQDFRDVSSGFDSTLICRDLDPGTYGYALYSVGLNTNGQLGDGTTVSKSSPVQIGSAEDWVNISSGMGFSFGIRHNGFDESGTLWGWGLGTSGQLGDGTTVSKSSPVQIGSGQYWYSVKTGATSNHTLAIYRDNVFDGENYNYVYGLYSWGSNLFGQLGDGTTGSKSSPVLISNDTFLFISTGNVHSAAIRNDFTLWTWGRNDNGQLGDGTTTAKSSPVQIPGSWYYVTCGHIHTIGIKSDLTIWGWGGNANGAIGDGTNIPKSSPVQIGSLVDWVGSFDTYAPTLTDAGTGFTLAVNYSQ